MPRKRSRRRRRRSRTPRRRTRRTPRRQGVALTFQPGSVAASVINAMRGLDGLSVLSGASKEDEMRLVSQLIEAFLNQRVGYRPAREQLNNMITQLLNNAYYAS